MVNIAARLMILLPTLNLNDVMLSSHHGNEQINSWMSPLQQPSPEELSAVSDIAAILQAERKTMIVKPWQFRKAINAAGKRTIVESALSSMTQDEQDGWHVASQFERLNPLVIKLASEILGYNDAQIDSFFRTAATL